MVGGVLSSQVTQQDLARSIYDVLSNIPALAGKEETPLTSWCGADAAAARGGAENPQKRRKRRRLEAQVCTLLMLQALHAKLAETYFFSKTRLCLGLYCHSVFAVSTAVC